MKHKSKNVNSSEIEIFLLAVLDFYLISLEKNIIIKVNLIFIELCY